MNRIQLASNENPFGPSPKAVEAMRAALAQCNFYPDNEASELRQKLAERHNLKPEQIVVAAGLTSFLDTIARTLLSPGLNAVTSQRSFIVYSLATKAAGGELIEVPPREDGFDLEGIAADINGNTRLVFLANPNNPTGTLVSADEFDRLLDKVPDHVLVILDEAYYDYAQYFTKLRHVEYSRSLDYVREGHKVMVLRTFSKAHGLAGIRVAYGMGPAESIASFTRMCPTYSVSVPAQAAAIAALEDEAHTSRSVEINAEQSEQLATAITALGHRVVPTWANFLYCELGEDAVAFAKRMREEGVLIRPLGSWGAPTAVRITVGTPEQNVIFLKAFRKVIERTLAQ